MNERRRHPAAAPGQGRQHVNKESPRNQGVVRDGQPAACEEQAGRIGVAERLVVPIKPGNAGGSWVDQHHTLGIGANTPFATGKLRIDGIDDPTAGWKGRSL